MIYFAIALTGIAFFLIGLEIDRIKDRLNALERSAPIADAPTDPPSDQFPTYDPVWESAQRRQARSDLGSAVE